LKSFFFKVSVVSYVFLYADFGKKPQKILARTDFTQNGGFMYERVKPGCFIDKQHRSMMKSFFFKVSLFLMYFYTLILEKILKNAGTYSFYTKWRISVWKGLSLIVLLISSTGR